jgi:hypothetical protein
MHILTNNCHWSRCWILFLWYHYILCSEDPYPLKWTNNLPLCMNKVWKYAVINTKLILVLDLTTGSSHLIGYWPHLLLFYFSTPGTCWPLKLSILYISALYKRKLMTWCYLSWLICWSGSLSKQNQPSTGFAPLVEPPESSIAMLVSMGFDSNAARQALVQARNDINVATNILLEAQSHWANSTQLYWEPLRA